LIADGDRLALEGGKPVRGTFLPFFTPDITEREVEEVSNALREGWLTYGPRTREFARRFAEHVGAAHAVPTSSCTASLFLSLEVLGIGRGDEVIVPALTFASTVHVIVQAGAKPVLADIETESFGLDPEEVGKAIGPRTRGILPVHYGGQACRIEELVALGRERGVPVIEDAAHSFGASLGGRRIGTFGDATCFSFYATKNITTGEGGMITTEDAGLAERLGLLAFHGLEGDAWQRYGSPGRWYYDVVEAGYKLNMNDLAAAIGLVQLERAEEIRAGRERVAEILRRGLEDQDDALELPTVRPGAEHTWHLFALRLRPEALECGRDRFIEALTAENVGSSVHFIPIHHHAYYRRTLGGEVPPLPRTEDFYARSLSLPIYSRMSDEDAHDVVRAVRKIVARYRRPRGDTPSSPS
jgi:dTDP-4-amino-4,6-dideoxygalactose transaminase